MKQTVTALALAAGVLAALPAWAQSPTAPGTTSMPSTSGPIVRPQAAPSTAPMTAPGSYSQTAPTGPEAMPSSGATTEATDEAMPKRHAARQHRARHHASAGERTNAGTETRSTSRRRGGAPNDNMANDLNRQEAARAASGAPSEPATGMSQGSSTGTMGMTRPGAAPGALPPPR